MVSLKPSNAINAEDIIPLADSFRTDCRETGHELGGHDFSPAKLIGERVWQVLNTYDEPYLTHREFLVIVNRSCQEVVDQAEQKNYPASTMQAVWDGIILCAGRYGEYFNSASALNRLR